MIIWLLLYGSPTNSLHESAMSWAWLMIAAVLSFLFGKPMIENVMAKK